jgi:arabinogalactan endo-1,4-beta-galactosidase
LNFCFEDYPGSNNFEEASTFIKNKFLALNNNTKDKHIYAHITTATDTDNIRFVFDAIQHIIIREAISQIQL